MSLSQKTVSDQRELARRDVRTAIKITALMGRMGLSQTSLAAKYGVQMEAINRTIWGVRKGKRLRSCIAYELGFSNWEELKKTLVKI